jgi:hypothetical protein
VRLRLHCSCVLLSAVAGLRYVSMFGGMIGYSSDDINKFLWMVSVCPWWLWQCACCVLVQVCAKMQL